MKIIGRTSSGYIVEATDYELANAAGYSQPLDAPGWEREGVSYHRGWFKIGTEFKPTEIHKYLTNLRANEDKVRQSETLLRALADMLHTALPTTIIPPTTEGEPT